MSTLKTVLMTTAVLVFGAAISCVGILAYYQQVEIRSLQTAVVSVQTQADDNDAHLRSVVKNAREAISKSRDREDKLRQAVLAIVDILKGSDSAPTNFTQSRNTEVQ